MGYLLKPVRKEQLAAALVRAGRLTRAQLQRLAASGAEARRTHIAARRREGLQLIPLEAVQYFLADQKYTTVRHVNGEDLIEDSLRLLETEFGNAFVRIHRNALVAVQVSRAHRARHRWPVLRASARLRSAARGEPAHGGGAQGKIQNLIEGGSDAARQPAAHAARISRRGRRAAGSVVVGQGR